MQTRKKKNNRQLRLLLLLVSFFLFLSSCGPLVHPTDQFCALSDSSCDTDGDTVFNGNDNCPADENRGQEDEDEDKVGDVCDNCLRKKNSEQEDVCDMDRNNNGLFEISTPEELYNIRYDPEGKSYKTSTSDPGRTTDCPSEGCNGYELVAEITLEGQWEPIPLFSGTFEGNKRAILNLTIELAMENLGFFGMLTGTVQNLRLEGRGITNLYSSRSTTGVLAAENEGEILNVDTIVSVNGGDNNCFVGGLVGNNNGTISNSSSAA